MITGGSARGLARRRMDRTKRLIMVPDVPHHGEPMTPCFKCHPEVAP